MLKANCSSLPLLIFNLFYKKSPNYPPQTYKNTLILNKSGDIPIAKIKYTKNFWKISFSTLSQQRYAILDGRENFSKEKEIYEKNLRFFQAKLPRFAQTSFSTLPQQRYARWAEEKFLFSKKKETLPYAKLPRFAQTSFSTCEKFLFSKKKEIYE